MKKNFTKLILSLFFCSFYHFTVAQSVISNWNFNSVPPDASTSTGSILPTIGNGTVVNVGGTSSSFASGESNAGSSDPVTTDDSGWGLSTWPTQGTSDKTAGFQFTVSTVGHSDIIVSFDLRHSNTGPRHFQFQYCLDATLPTPVWVNFSLDSALAGDAWVSRNYNLSTIPALNNNANASFRVLATFQPLTNTYKAATTTSNYSTSGTWRLDMLSVKGTSSAGDINPPIAQSFRATSAVSSFVVFNEAVTIISATNIANFSFTPSLAISNLMLSNTGDTLFLTHAPFVNGAPYTLAISGIQDNALNNIATTNFNVVFNAAIPNLVITEIVHSPNDIEYVEVYNAAETAVNLGGLRWSNGTSGNFPTITLASKGTVLFGTNPTTVSSALSVSPVYTLLSGLGSSDDILVIRNSNNEIIDSVSYFVGTNGWPTAPFGVYGYSFELNNATNDNNIGNNWIIPQNPVIPQPSQGLVRATPGIYPTPAYTPLIANVSFVGSKISVTENTTEINIIANLVGNGALPASIDLEILPISTATIGNDFTTPLSMQYNWDANATNIKDTIKFSINNDALPENAEYIIVRFVNPVNIALPLNAANHFTVVITDDDLIAPVASESIILNHIASFSNGAAATNSAEIVVHDPTSQRLFVANSKSAKIDIVNFSNPAAASIISSISIASYGNINSIAVKNGIVAAAIENVIPELPGKIVFFDTNGNFINQVNAGSMPDMILFSPDGNKVLTANEGQPKSDYSVDPEGSISIVDISTGAANVSQANVSTVTFTNFNADSTLLRASGVRIFGLNFPTVAKDIEPEYITISADGNTAWVTCQENNAIAVIDLTTNTVTAIRPLGTKNHLSISNSLDISDQGGKVEIANWPVKGLYMPDGIASFTVNGQTYLITANEGDAREYGTYEEVTRLSSLTYTLDPTAFPYADALKANIGRLNVSKASGDTDGDGDYDEIHTLGGRSISIWNATTGNLVWDSGNQLELITSKHPVFGAIFNVSNSNNTFKNRSDDKGPEPEGVTIAQINGKTYAFIALERIGGCMVYDVTNPLNPIYVDYKNTRNVISYGGDNGAEGIIFISEVNSPTGIPIVILANEVSSTLSFFSIISGVLDVKLNTIKADNIGSKNLVQWSTLSETTKDLFEIERSNNGLLFSSIKTIPANGISSSYSFVDESPFKGVNFYRLKIKHSSGKITYSAVVKAIVKNNNNIIQLFPNPVKDQLTIKINKDNIINVSAAIIDTKGVVIKNLLLNNQTTFVDLTNLSTGTYILRYYHDNIVNTIKFTKQ